MERKGEGKAMDSSKNLLLPLRVTSHSTIGGHATLTRKCFSKIHLAQGLGHGGFPALPVLSHSSLHLTAQLK